jgi:ribose transport system substrate-binding protein
VIKRIFSLSAICLSFWAAACGGAPSSGSISSGQQTLGIVTFSTSDVITNRFLDAVKSGMEKKGWKVDSVDANGSLANANTAMRALVTRRVSAILVTVFPASSLTEGLAATRQARIPVIDAGGGLGDGVGLAIDTGIPGPMVNYMLRQINDQGKVLNLTYHPGLPCRERADAMDAAAKANPGIQLTDHEISIPGAAETSQAATAAWLAANPPGSAPNFAIFNCYDDNAMGAIAALKQANRTDVKVYSFNGTPPALQAIKDGWMTATLWLDLVASSSTIIDDLPKMVGNSNWKAKDVPSPYVIVDKSNIDQFEAQHPGVANS